MQRSSRSSAGSHLVSEMARVLRILFVERRLPGKLYQLYYSMLNRLGIRVTTVHLANGFTVRGYTHCFFMFYEVWDKKDYDIPGFSLARNMTVVDIGANQGFFTLYAASKGATVYAFEPCSENFEMLKWNVLKNEVQDRVRMVNAAVTGKDGEVEFFVGLDGSGNIMSGTASTRNEDRGGRGVEARSAKSVTLDSLLSDLQIDRCDFLKMDCEGAEYEILAGASQESFRKIARISVECHENRMQEAAAILENAGFRIVYARQSEAGILKATNAFLTS